MSDKTEQNKQKRTSDPERTRGRRRWSHYGAEKWYEQRPASGSAFFPRTSCARMSISAGQTCDALSETVVLGRGSEDIVAEVPIEQEPEPIRSPKTVPDDRHWRSPEAGSHDDVVIGLHVDVRLRALADRCQIQPDLRLFSRGDDPDQINARGLSDRSQSARRGDEAAQRQPPDARQLVYARSRNFTIDVHEALVRSLDKDAVIRPDDDVVRAVPARQASVVNRDDAIQHHVGLNGLGCRGWRRLHALSGHAHPFAALLDVDKGIGRGCF